MNALKELLTGLLVFCLFMFCGVLTLFSTFKLIEWLGWLK